MNNEDPPSHLAATLADGSYMPRHTSRHVAEHYHVKNGKLVGRYEAYFDNGYPSILAQYNDDGALEGPYIQYESDVRGQVEEEKFFRNGKLDGIIDRGDRLTIFKDNKSDFTRTALLRYVVLPGVKFSDFVQIALLGTRQERPDTKDQIKRAKKIAMRL